MQLAREHVAILKQPEVLTRLLVFSLSFEKHNHWSRVVPSGVTETDLKNRLRITTLTERERSVCRLVLDTAPPAEFTLTVKFITDSIGFSAEKIWPKVRDGLILKGILNAHSERLGHGEKRWHLNFDFTVIAAGKLDADASDEKLSTPQAQRGGSHARACDPPIWGGSGNPPGFGGLEPENLEPETTTTKPAVVTEKEETQIHWPAGLSDGQKTAARAALAGLVDHEKQQLLDELAGALMVRLVMNPAGWLRSLVERQKHGGLLLELAPDIAAARAARAAQAAREKAAALAADIDLPRSPQSTQLTDGQVAGLAAALSYKSALKELRS